jgi:hypothetical protein
MMSGAGDEYDAAVQEVLAEISATQQAAAMPQPAANKPHAMMPPRPGQQPPLPMPFGNASASSSPPPQTPPMPIFSQPVFLGPGAQTAASSSAGQHYAVPCYGGPAPSLLSRWLARTLPPALLDALRSDTVVFAIILLAVFALDTSGLEQAIGASRFGAQLYRVMPPSYAPTLCKLLIAVATLATLRYFVVPGL